MRSHLVSYMTVIVLSAAAAAGADKVNPVNRDGKGLALGGYDAVAYFAEKGPVKGSASFTHQWMGATWRFASSENRDRFAATPENFAPQFGGYCAWAVSNNYTAPVDPAAWKIVEGKLYLNYSKKVQEMWQKELPARIRTAEKNWPGLHN